MTLKDLRHFLSIMDSTSGKTRELLREVEEQCPEASPTYASREMQSLVVVCKMQIGLNQLFKSGITSFINPALHDNYNLFPNNSGLVHPDIKTPLSRAVSLSYLSLNQTNVVVSSYLKDKQARCTGQIMMHITDVQALAKKDKPALLCTRPATLDLTDVQGLTNDLIESTYKLVTAAQRATSTSSPKHYVTSCVVCLRETHLAMVKFEQRYGKKLAKVYPTYCR